MHCSLHPEQELVLSGRYRGRPMRRCPICIEAARAKLAELKAHYQRRGDRTKQTVLKPVMMSERWP